MTVAIKKILAEVNALSDMERHELELALQQGQRLAHPPMTEEQFARHLEQQQIIAASPQPAHKPRNFRPVPIKGKPLSQTLIEDRR